jgi:peptidoglycan hydrolase CwlO-like protein
MQKNNIIIIVASAVVFILCIAYVLWHQTSVVSDIFKHHREQLQNEIKAIQTERLLLKQTIDSLDTKINLDKKDLLNDIDSFLRKHGKK